jgi:hypothetical protein
VIVAIANGRLGYKIIRNLAGSNVRPRSVDDASLSLIKTSYQKLTVRCMNRPLIFVYKDTIGQ